MPLFGSASSMLEQEIEKATLETIVKEDVSAMFEVCDRVNSTQDGTREAYRCLVKRLQNPNPRVVMLTLGVLDVCVMNCGKKFHLEICSRDFTTQIKTILSRGHPKVQDKLKFLLCKWANNEFKSDPQLAIIDNFIQRAKMDGVNFEVQDPSLETMDSKPTQRSAHQQQQEEDDLAKAIELSLQESKKKSDPRSGTSTGSGLYPSMSKISSITSTTGLSNSAPSGTSSAPPPKAKESRKVRALYDFEAAEENELSFKAGEIIIVLEDRDPNWWKGSNHRGEGLFPSNFVTADLEAPPEETAPASEAAIETPVVASVTQVDEVKINALLHMLHDADPTVLERTETDAQMEQLQAECALMTPLIDAELEKIDRKHQSLTTLSQRLTDALATYHQLLRQPQMPFMPSMMGVAPQGPPGVPQMTYYSSPPIGVQPQGFHGLPMALPGVIPPSRMQPVPPQQPVVSASSGRSIVLPGQMPPPGAEMPPSAHMVMGPPYGYPHPTMNGTVNGALPPEGVIQMGVPPSQIPPGPAQ
ncbi:signal transducing adapter molecule 2-like isoform X1 [Varroa destructor]|uniref:Signal transducing adapter molecule 1 n=2 Tax=Varroa destructor TaxID=109461 RepID=A0A7M7JW05_VARDE|nr:signal transducing adapter molecule 2-like isoform X1 [Varroa destructor]XP_022657665.1 signal transducing adapter molecule 2-like isoform X1 [Varroa destructor]